MKEDGWGHLTVTVRFDEPCLTRFDLPKLSIRACRTSMPSSGDDKMKEKWAKILEAREHTKSENRKGVTLSLCYRYVTDALRHVLSRIPRCHGAFNYPAYGIKSTLDTS